MPTLTVMTRNLYVGSEFAPVLEATSLQEALEAVPAVLDEVRASDFPGRSRLVAAELAEARPDVVGLQEAVLVRSGAPDAAAPTETVLDYLSLLLEAATGRGMDYRVVAQTTNIDASMPSGLPPTALLRLTDRDVLLIHPDLPIFGVRSGTFDARGSFDVGGIEIELTRGWISAEVEVGDHALRIVSTHLETSQFPDVQLEQAHELLAGPLRADGPILVMGDLNAQAPDAPAYRLLLDAGFRDGWAATHPDDPGLTCCQDPDLRNADDHLYERIDLVLVRGDIEVVETRRTGVDASARTPGGLWASDHAGVVASLQV
jgi:endonuclease/exonuclease/phosphatase family metal-dependent hydrolase